MERYDVAVIGAGPAGCMAARYASRTGARTAILEENRAVGHPVQCAGLLGRKALAEAELPEGNYLIHPLRGAKVFSPGGCSLSFKAANPRAWLVDRRMFDRSMALEAVKAGAELHLGTRVRGCESGDRIRLILDQGRDISASVVISAEGVGARIARLMGLPPPRTILSGAQVEVPFRSEDVEMVEVYLGLVPGLFAWIIPIDPTSARIGICSRDRACHHLRSFMGSGVVKERILGSPVAVNLGGLPMGLPPSTVGAGILAVGDAAGQVKPTSGGGIYPGLVCAKIAGQVAALAALEGDTSTKRLQEYEHRWRGQIGGELEIGWHLHRVLDSFSGRDLDSLVDHIGKRSKLLRVIEELGDIDHPSAVVSGIIPLMIGEGFGIAWQLAGALARGKGILPTRE